MTHADTSCDSVITVMLKMADLWTPFISFIRLVNVLEWFIALLLASRALEAPLDMLGSLKV